MGIGKLLRSLFTKNYSALPLLPDEVWFNIFSYLSYEELKKVSLASKQWNDLISKSSCFIQRTRFCMVVDFSSTISNYKSVLNASNRCYSCFQVSEIIDTGYISSLSWFTTLTQFELSNCSINGLNLLNLLRKSTSIRALMLRAVKITEKDDATYHLELKLVDLALQHENRSTDWIMDRLHCTKISNLLEIRGFRSTAWRKSDSVINFLNRIEGNINMLLIDGINLDNIASPKTVRPCFNFKWRYMYMKPFESVLVEKKESRNLKRLCFASAKIATLKLTWTHQSNSNNCREKAYNVMNILKYCDCSKIHTLIFGWWELRDFQRSDFAHIGTLNSVKTLRFQCSDSSCLDPEIIEEAFFSILPSVVNLSIEFTDVDCFNRLDMAMISSKLKKLQNIRIEWKSYSPKEWRSIDLKKVSFPKLTTLSLGPIGMMLAENTEIAEQLTVVARLNRELRVITFIDELGCLNYDESHTFLESLCQFVGSSSVHGMSIARIHYSRYSTLSSSDVPFRENLKIFATKSIVVDMN